MLPVQMEEGEGKGGAWYLFHISKLTLPYVSVELINDTFDGAGHRLCVTGGKKVVKFQNIPYIKSERTIRV